MSPDKIVRRALQISVPFNLGAALLFAFPGSVLGKIAGFPAAVPGLYCAMLAVFVTLFGGTYAWLAVQRDIDRPLIAFSAIGKSGAFVTILGFWVAGQSPARAVVLATGDLVLAAVFAWWLIVTSDSAAARDAIAEMPSR
jgi:hypothetical protein